MAFVYDRKLIVLVFALVGAFGLLLLITDKGSSQNTQQETSVITKVVEKAPIVITKEKDCSLAPPRRHEGDRYAPHERNPFTDDHLRNLYYENNQEKQKRFQTVYSGKQWVHDGKAPLSGGGSTVAYTEQIRHGIKAAILSYGAKVFIDAPCGDMTWMRELFPWFKENGIKYIGADIVPELIAQHKKEFESGPYADTVSFIHMDLSEGVLPKADIIFCRQALQHLNPGNVIRTLENFCTSGSKYLMTTVYLTGGKQDNEMHITGPYNSNQNYMAPPYNFEDPVAMFVDGVKGQRQYMALWELPFVGCRSKQ